LPNGVLKSPRSGCTRDASQRNALAQSVGHTIYNIGRLFAWLLPLKDPKFITGYSTLERDVAFMAGELDAFGTTTITWFAISNGSRQKKSTFMP
jgi:hypothetical protein